jgi:hypothetical protein
MAIKIRYFSILGARFVFPEDGLGFRFAPTHSVAEFVVIQGAPLLGSPLINRLSDPFLLLIIV